MTTPTATATPPQIYYQKRANKRLFERMANESGLFIKNAQNYNPLYSAIFSLNASNYTNVNLNHEWFIEDIKASQRATQQAAHAKTDDDGAPLNVLTCKLGHTSEYINSTNKQVFVKIVPLFDPISYICGKYPMKPTENSEKFFRLPVPNPDPTQYYPKIISQNNKAYVDNFFIYLTNMLLQNGFKHGLEYYGSFMGIKHQLPVNIGDDYEYIYKHPTFLKNIGRRFVVNAGYEHLFEPIPTQDTESECGRNTLQLGETSNTIADTLFDEIPATLSTTLDAADADTDKENNNNITTNPLLRNPAEIIDKFPTEFPTDFPADFPMDLPSESSSEYDSESEYSNTDTNSLASNTTNADEILECNGETTEEAEETNNDNQSTLAQSEEDSSTISGSESGSESGSTYTSSLMSSDDFSRDIFITVDKMPVHIIFMEKCVQTLNMLIMTDALKTDDEWFSALMQIIMTLIAYQKLFAFTHNDLHSANIMYIETAEKWLYYQYEGVQYRVPTYGRIFKIIDFGRAIYTVSGLGRFCNDDFDIQGGNASGQYNTEPYFNPDKPRIEPNYSFDLCRLACSILDFVLDTDEDDAICNADSLHKCTSPLQKLIVEWCLDDAGKNIYYKKSGYERYGEFKLYKMIARLVHNHTPDAQLKRPEFAKYIWTPPAQKHKAKTTLPVMNIDALVEAAILSKTPL